VGLGVRWLAVLLNDPEVWSVAASLGSLLGPQEPVDAGCPIPIDERFPSSSSLPGSSTDDPPRDARQLPSGVIPARGTGDLLSFRSHAPAPRGGAFLELVRLAIVE